VSMLQYTMSAQTTITGKHTSAKRAFHRLARRNARRARRLYASERSTAVRGCVEAGRRRGGELSSWTAMTALRATSIVGGNWIGVTRRSVGVLLCATMASGSATSVAVSSSLAFTEYLVLCVVFDIAWWTMTIVTVSMLQYTMSAQTTITDKHTRAKRTFHRFLVHIPSE